MSTYIATVIGCSLCERWTMTVSPDAPQVYPSHKPGCPNTGRRVFPRRASIRGEDGDFAFRDDGPEVHLEPR